MRLRTGLPRSLAGGRVSNAEGHSQTERAADKPVTLHVSTPTAHYRENPGELELKVAAQRKSGQGLFAPHPALWTRTERVHPRCWTKKDGSELVSQVASRVDWDTSCALARDEAGLLSKRSILERGLSTCPICWTMVKSARRRPDSGDVGPLGEAAHPTSTQDPARGTARTSDCRVNDGGGALPLKESGTVWLY